MDKYIERSKYGFFELRYVSENGSAGPDFRIYGEIEEVGEISIYRTSLLSPLRGVLCILMFFISALGCSGGGSKG